jgi:hypothetical protein
MHSKKEELCLIPGFGDQKVARLVEAFETPFKMNSG